MTEKQPEPADARSGAMTKLRVASPWVTSFTLPLNGGASLVVDRKGTEVPAESVKELMELAAQHGVALMEVSE